MRVAELLAEHTPGDFAKKTVLVNSGAEAVENGVKIARKYTGRTGVAVLDHAYHGRTNLTMAMNFKAMPYSLGLRPVRRRRVPRAQLVPAATTASSGAEAAARTIAYLEKTVGASDLACLVVEPIQGEGGFIVPADGYLPALQEWCTANGIVFIADEIQCGMARTGAYFASEHFGLVPDMVLDAPRASRAACRSRASPAAPRSWMPPSPGGLGGTFGGNPVACAAAIAVFEQIEQRRPARRGRPHRERRSSPRCSSCRQKYPIIGEVRGIGAMIAIELVDPETHEPDARDAVSRSPRTPPSTACSC